jgi:hypothetical protein
MPFHDPHRTPRQWSINPVGAKPQPLHDVPTLAMGQEIARRFVELGRPVPRFASVEVVK